MWTESDDPVARHRAEVRDGVLAQARRMRWSSARLADERQQRLRELLTWAADRSPFHAARLAGVDPGRITEAGLAGLPSMTKDDLMEEFSRITTDPRLTLEAVEDYLEDEARPDYLFDQFRVVSSSGSGGRRGIYVYGWDEWTTLALLQIRPRLGVVDGSPRPAGAATVSLFGTGGMHMSRALQLLLTDPDDPVVHVPMTLSVPEIVHRLNEIQPELVMGYPTALDVLVRESEAGRLEIAPRHVEAGGEVLLERTRSAVRDQWGVEIDDCWAMSEGLIAHPCRMGREMHLPDDLVVVEPVDPEGRPVPMGEPAAKILVTSLYNRTQPLIRFEVPDGLTMFDDVCACGSSHRRVADITGRESIPFHYDNGVVVSANLIGMMFNEDRHVIEHQICQTERGVSIDLVTDRPDALEQIRCEARTALEVAGLSDPEVAVHRVDRLQRASSGKLQMFIPLRGPAPGTDGG